MAQWQIKKPQAQTLQQRMGFVDNDLTTPGHDAIMFWLDEHTTSTQLAKWRGRDGWIEEEIDRDNMTRRLQQFITTPQSNLDDAQHTKDQLHKDIRAYQAGIDGTKPYKKSMFDAEVPVDRLRQWLLDKQSALPAAEANVRRSMESLEIAKHKAQMPPLLEWPGFELTKKEWEQPVKPGYTYIGFIDFVAHYRHPSLDISWKGNEPPQWVISWQDRQIYFEVKMTIPSLGELFRQLSQYRQELPHKSPIVVVSPDVRFVTKIREQGYGFIRYEP
jgi:hypothetical protein